MKVLVATRQTQGQRKTDFCHAREGELVGFLSECAREPIDGPCGCRRSFNGLESSRATTTVQVVDQDMTVEDLTKAVHASLVAGGWTKDGDPEGVTWARKDAAELARLAATFAVGDVVEKRGPDLRLRLHALN